MPNKRLEALRVGMDKHAGRKLSDEQKQEIRGLYEAGGISQRALATQYGVSRRLIGFIIHPEKLAENRSLRKAKGHFYDKEKHRVYMAIHRARKRELLKNKM